MRNSVFLLVLAAAPGCNNEALSIPAETVTGIYRLHVKTNADDCDPLRFVGDAGDVLVVIKSAGMAVAVPDSQAGSKQLVDLLASKGYGLQQNLGPFDNAVRRENVDIQLLKNENGKLEVSAIFDWSIDPSKGALQGAPVRTCRSDQLLTYDLIMACPTPLRLLLDHTTLRCE